MMVASALMETLASVFLRLLGDQGSQQAQVLLFRSGMHKDGDTSAGLNSSFRN